jgi:2-polyprenyl-6-methoxyphenol hydroxylase-like FAD-dependent oxidoreductase
MNPAQPHDEGHALVIGAGICGLAMARALSETFSQVTIVERDHLPADPRPRPGVPQGRHGHALAARGRQVLEVLFPGISQELRAEGAPTVDFCRQARHHWPAGVPTPISSEVLIQPVSRPLLETVLRRRVGAIPGVRIMEGCTVTGLQTDTRGITGVHLTRQTDGPTGRNAGRTATTISACVGYASRAYHTDPGTAPDWRALFEIPHAPELTRSCFALHIEGHRLLVSLQGTAGDHPPTDEDGFELFMKSLNCDLAAFVATLRPASKVYRYGRSTGRRRLYHRLKFWPDGLIALDDAACTFNPLYAQGMTVAGLEALALSELLNRSTRTDLRGFSTAFQRRVGRITSWPWTLSALADRAWTETTPLVRTAHWYLSTCQDLAIDDTPMFHDLARVTNMLAGPTALARPRHLVQILRSRL